MGEEIRRIVRTLCLNMKELADELGVGHDTVKGWGSMRSEPSPENRKALAAFLRRHANRLESMAAVLEADAPGTPSDAC